MKIKANVEPGTFEIPDEEILSRTAKEVRAFVDEHVREWLKSDAKVEWAFDASTCHSQVSEVLT